MSEVKWDFGRLTGIVSKYRYIFLVIAAGFVLMMLPSGEKTVKTEQRAEAFDLAAFEKRIEKALSGCEGVGRCEVMLSVKSGTENVFANEARESRREDESVTESDIDTKPSIINGETGSEAPVLIKEVYPEFRGAVIICDGAESAALRTRITEAVSALTGLRSDRISVIKMKE